MTAEEFVLDLSRLLPPTAQVALPDDFKEVQHLQVREKIIVDGRVETI